MSEPRLETRTDSSKTTSSLPPGPKGHWLTGTLKPFRSDPLKFVQQCVAEYGDVTRLRLGIVDAYLLRNPDYIDQVMGPEHYQNFTKHKLFRRLAKRIIGGALTAAEGEAWLRQRRLEQPAFRHDRLEAMGEVMIACWQEALQAWRAGEVIEIQSAMMDVALDIATKALFAAEVGRAEEVAANLKVLLKTVEATRSFLTQIIPYSVPTPSNLRLKRAIGGFDQVIMRIIKERRASGKQTADLLSILMHMRDQDGNQLSDQQVRDEVLAAFLGSFETTALAMTWSLYLISLHPEAKKKLYEEVDAVLQGRPAKPSDVAKLQYAERVIREAMRLYPPVWIIGREAAIDCQIGGYQVAKGTTVYSCTWVSHRDPRYFDNPEQFDPDRWTDEFTKKLPRFAYYPFGGGPRVCIGERFARMEAVLGLASIAQRYVLDVEPDQDISLWATMTLRPKNGIRMKVRNRE